MINEIEEENSCKGFCCVETKTENQIKFLKEVIEVCKKYGFSISHEDGHGAFLVEKYDDYSEWLLAAPNGIDRYK